LAGVVAWPWCGVLELMSAVNPVLCSGFGEAVLQDARGEVIDVDG
jgi:hypothetical protein